jgi:hypothetical protein
MTDVSCSWALLTVVHTTSDGDADVGENRFTHRSLTDQNLIGAIQVEILKLI